MRGLFTELCADREGSPPGGVEGLGGPTREQELHLKRQEEGEAARPGRKRAVSGGPPYHGRALVRELRPHGEGAGRKTSWERPLLLCNYLVVFPLAKPSQKLLEEESLVRTCTGWPPRAQGAWRWRRRDRGRHRRSRCDSGQVFSLL